MQEKRCAFSAVVLDGNIYATGGHCDPDFIESVERYSPTTNSWGYVRRNFYCSKCFIFSKSCKHLPLDTN